jgi:hypothetical protein
MRGCAWLGNPFVFDLLSRMLMIADPESLVPELRFLPGIKDVDIIPFPAGKELWITLKESIDLNRLRKASESLGYHVIRVGSFPSMLPRSLGEMIWDGLTYVISKSKRRCWMVKPAFEVASIVRDLATGDLTYHISDNDGLKILHEYLGN